MQEALQEGASNLFLDFRVEIISIGYNVSPARKIISQIGWMYFTHPTEKRS